MLKLTPPRGISGQSPCEFNMTFAEIWPALHRAYATRAIVLHELTHLCCWFDGHGPDFCGACVWLWQLVFGLSRARSLAIAAELSLPVNAEMPWRPSLRTRFVKPRPFSCRA